MPPSQQLTIEQAISKAKKAAKQGNTTLALELYNVVLQNQPNHPVAKKGLRKLQKWSSRNQTTQIEAGHPPQDQINALTNLYHSGQIVKTEQLCKELLKVYPQSLDVLSILGAALYGQGKLQEVVNIYDKFIQIKTDSAEAYYNRGLALQGLGQQDKAVASYDKAIQIRSDYTEAYYNRGNALQELRQYDKAIASYDKAIQISPDSVESYSNRGNALKELGQYDKAVASYDKAIQISPDSAEAHSNRGNVLKELGQYDKAVASYDKAIQISPDSAEAYYNRGNALKKLGQYDKAVESYSMATQINPNFAEAYSNLGNALTDLRQLESAIESHNKATQINPNFAEAYSNLGKTLQELGQLDDAIENYNKAIKINPNYALGHFNLSMALLLSGNFQKGWKEYEWRWEYTEFSTPKRDFLVPQWDGSLLNDKKILLHAEQGIGDTIQFIRYVAEVAKYNGNIIVECQSPLKRLLSSLSAVDLLIVGGDILPDFDVHAPLMSLPYILGTEVSSIPNNVPYLFADHAGNMDQVIEKQLSIGIVWAGSPAHKNDKNRSVSLDHFLSLLSVPNIQLYSLQVGDRKADLDSIFCDSDIIDLTDNISDYADTAAIVGQLDLVISVDTSVAHLAGAMGKPVWVLLPFSPDFRWMLDRCDSPWYPTMRLFRQRNLDDWGSVFSEIYEALLTY